MPSKRTKEIHEEIITKEELLVVVNGQKRPKLKIKKIRKKRHAYGSTSETHSRQH